MVKVLSSREGYDLYANEYAGDHRKLDSFDRPDFMQLLPDKADVAVELGIGDGRISGEIARRSENFVGIDISLKMLQNAIRRSPRTQIVQADLAENLPLGDECVDFLVAAFYFVHIKNPDLIIAEAARVLKPGGIFLFNLIPQRREPELKAGKQRFKIRSYYHSPPHVEKILDYHWFNWDVTTVTEGKGWVSKIYRCQKT
ncbi:MAG: class I SAM-dependent methyltransferase [Acidobacteria bacterium]|nr:class I SAM-dependent methyltransferase [Acidobacteriota bacterium]